MDSGEIYINGEKKDCSSPKKALKAGIGFVSDDRKQEGLVLIRNIRENVSLSSLDKITHFIHLDKKLETKQINAQVKRLNIKISSLQQLAGALVREVRPTALICVDSLCSSEPQRLGRTLQFSDTGLCPAQPGSSKHLDAARLGLPVIAAGIPTLMMAQEGKDLVVTPRELDSVIAHGAALLGAAINRALQPRLSIAQLCWLVG